MRDLSVEGDSTCLQAICDPFGRTMTSVAGAAYRGVAGSVPNGVPENSFFAGYHAARGNPRRTLCVL